MLDKGLTFIPTYRLQPIDRIYEVQHRLVRNLKLKDYFSTKPDKPDFDYKTKTFTNPSTWTPADHKVGEATLDTVQKVISATENIIQKYKIQNGRCMALRNIKNNLTHAERAALQNLKTNSSIVIKPADKGSATVVMDKENYLAEAYRQLNDTNYYTKLDGPIYQNNISKINAILLSMKAEGYIDNKQFNYLQAKDSDRSRVFYLLPKIHKPKEKWPNPKMPQGRPIVSDCGSESYRVSEYIDSFIRPISTKHPSYLKDTYDFVSKIRGQRIPKNAILVTGDVSSLYTNMKIDRILEVSKNALAKHRPTTGRRPDKHLLQLLEITLKNNDFTFNGEHFLQTCGTAMGKNYAPGLADLYMEEFDYQATHGFRIKPLLYSRYLDDIFFIFPAPEEDLKEFESFLNSLISGIKITLVYSYEKVDFLDTTIYKLYETNADVLQTRVFFKETDTHQLLDRNSFHPKHTARGVLKSQLLRFKRISSSFSDYDESCRILFNALSKRNYAKSMLRKMKRDIWLSSESARVKNDNNKILPIIIPYNNIGTEMARAWKTAIGENNLFQNYRLITAYCNGKSLHKNLIHSSLVAMDHQHTDRRIVTSQSAGNIRCTNTRCKACNYITEARSFNSSYNGRGFQLHAKFTCRSNNIVYLVTCSKCNKQYVGETGRSLGERVVDHLSCIRLRKQTPIGLHLTVHYITLNIFQFWQSSSLKIAQMQRPFGD